MLRNRDILAAVLALILTRIAWNDQAENLTVSIHLAFYFPFAKYQVAPAAFDVDGDGTAEALVIVKPVGENDFNSKNAWVIQLLDLKPLHYSSYNAKSAIGAPFQPTELLRSEPIVMTTSAPSEGEEENRREGGDLVIKPLQLVTGQVKLRGVAKRPSEHDFDVMSHDERTKHYFCGHDWHDAANNCGTPCPSGTSDDCPDGERCYADTPCDSQELASQKKETEIDEDNVHLTPAGGLPSCFTVWSDGRVTMHSLTSRKDEEEPEEEASSSLLLNPRNLSVSGLQAKLKRTLSARRKTPLELMPMWTATAFPQSPDQILNPSKVQLTFLDAFDSIPDARHGMLIVSGDLTPDPGPEGPPLGIPLGDPMKEPRFMVALDAMTGEVLWDSLQNFKEEEENVPLPLHIDLGSSSLARRRSKVAHLDISISSSSSGTSGADDIHQNGVLPNCLAGYRNSLLGATDALPYSYWGPADAGVRAVHLDHSNTQQKLQRHEQHQAHKYRSVLSSSSSSSQNHRPGETSPHHYHRHGNKKGAAKSPYSWHSALINTSKRGKQLGTHGGHVHYGRPNVLINYHAGGLHVHSLQNGHALCHLSLLEEALYVDLQRDGVMDSVQVITNGKNLVMDPTTGTYADPWVAQLASRVQGAEDETKDQEERARDAQKNYHQFTRLCHAMALSGQPAREELFSTPLCGTSGSKRHNTNNIGEHNADHPWTPVHAAPPIVVESMYSQHRHREKDVIFAMSNGVVSRIRGGTGRRQWKLNGKKVENFPTWGRWEATHTVSLTRLQVDDVQVAPYARPILLVGESSMAVLSATSPTVLATANIPQRSLRRPILKDVSGDGVSDVLVTTADGVWCYQVVVRTGASIFFRILVGLLLMGIMVALLRNRYGGSSVRDRYKRSTDP